MKIIDKITIGRWRDMDTREDSVHVEITDSKGFIVYRGEMSMVDFARMITGSGDVHIEREIFE